MIIITLVAMTLIPETAFTMTLDAMTLSEYMVLLHPGPFVCMTSKVMNPILGWQ